MAKPVHVHTDRMDWAGSPGTQVWRKRLHRVGPTEAGQVTSVVRYDPGSAFPAHDHPDGEEILVLDGVFSDQQGDFPRGSYLLNPEGFEHGPSSAPGCLLFVKLRQYPGAGRTQMAVDTAALPREGLGAGVHRRLLYQEADHPESMELLQLAAGARLPEQTFVGGAEIFVIEGALRVGDWSLKAKDWLRLPPGSSHDLVAAEGALIYRKCNGLTELTSQP